MKRRINSTGRRRIERRHVAIRLRRIPGHERPRIEANFNLEDLGLDPSAQLVLEARFKDIAQRFPSGTAARPEPRVTPRSMSCHLIGASSSVSRSLNRQATGCSL